MLGSAASNGWDGNNDIPFTEDDTKKGLWKLSNVKLVAGELKFRFNNDWTINYGDNNNDTVLDSYGANIKVEAGIYDIILDFSKEDDPRYTLLKK